MRRTEREDEPLLRGRSLQLEVETLAERLAQREAPGAIDAAAEGRVQHELHAARLVEEAFQGKRVRRRHYAEGALAFAEILGDLRRGRFLEMPVGLQEPHCIVQLIVSPRVLGTGELE